jgi:hypothetical protein
MSKGEETVRQPTPIEQLLSSPTLPFGDIVTVLGYASLGMTLDSLEPFACHMEGFLVPLLPDKNMPLYIERPDYRAEYALPVVDPRFVEVVQENCDVHRTAEGDSIYCFPVVLTGKLVPYHDPTVPEVKAALDNLVSGTVLIEPLAYCQEEIPLVF